MCSVYDATLIYFFFTARIILGQTSGTALLLDSQTNEPVPYASVGSGSFSILTNLNGYFSMDSFIGRSILINRLGYESLSIPFDEIGDTLFLEPVSFALDVVEISPERIVKEAGFHRMKSCGRIPVAYYRGHCIISHFLPTNARITKVYAHLFKNQKGYNYRINLFDVTDSGLPGSLIYSKEYTSERGTNLLTVPIDKVPIPRNGSVAIVLYWEDNSIGEMERRILPELRITDENIGIDSFHFLNITKQWHIFNMRPAIGCDWNYKIGLEYTEY